MWRVVTYISNQKISISYTTALKNIPGTLGFSPSLTNVLNNCAHILLAFHRFPTTYRQFSSNAVRELLRLEV